LLVEEGLATAPPADSSPSLQSSSESIPPSNPNQNDPSSSSESDDGSGDDSDVSESEDDSDVSESEDDSDDSSFGRSPFQPQPREHIHALLFEGANSSLFNALCPSSITNPNIRPFVRAEDPSGGEDYVEIMLDSDDPLASDSEEAKNVTSVEDELSSIVIGFRRRGQSFWLGLDGGKDSGELWRDREDNHS
ncbi:hypothetical protein Dimus_032014, partial [Dionaea muscipula]